MQYIDASSRWTYDGSLTTPPYTPNVQWNVVTRVFPIKKKHLELFDKMLDRAVAEIPDEGNFREIQPTTDKHNVRLVGVPFIPVLAFMGAMIGLAIFAFILLICVIVLCCKRNKQPVVNHSNNVEMTDTGRAKDNN